ncbi:aldehyde ferredoxin oxidoreductase [Limnohabitans sp. TS-CS-82]|jgi:aldehyde:ferredoxin oxidoreductase|uniref:aldehyde ferredoxin oxidoreductase family protein n=1 Tax=Limnohabitans sp. TS-CS-82 TaxID=2094193 RepID=UPI000CF2E4DB|nr:aldehyde ferredoxin oxidoreductase family protein [Limnohabitans sp. TS-CS-82]PQA80527.1 aldehyde ferredoxin oxidoreductase [Limnohabitans sp. TS-CS-82]
MTWAGKILRINLTTGSVKTEPLNMQWARDYVGSRGLGSKYLINEIDPKVDPLSPENKLIWATGPLTGTMASTGGRYTVITKGPLTGAIACSNSGGYFGAELKMAGWDMVICEGKSPKPVYLYINDDTVELRDASGLWGKSVWETEAELKKTLQDPLTRVSSIGKAGENHVLYAAVVNDLHRAAGRSGVGAVMGSKNLKAIAVRGTLGVGNVRDPKAFMQVTAEKKKILADNAVTGQGLPAYGTQVLMNVINEVGALPTRNHRDVQFEGAKDISAEAMATPRETDGKKHLVTNQACFGCTIACGRISKMDETHFTVQNKPQYWGASGGLEYEAAWALGAANGVKDLEALQYANLLCNEEGIDPISFGATVGAVMELYEMGVLTQEQLGIDAKFGSAQALAFFAEETVNGRGFGIEIGQGSKRLTEKYGHPDLSMSVKGQEFPAYDGRAIQGIGLAYATSNRGACHLRGYTIASEVLGIPVKTDPLEHEGKPELVKAFQDATAAFDSSGLCIFTTFAWGLADLAPQMQAACNEDYTTEELEKIGERIWNMEREFNNAAGFTAKDDSLPKRLLTEAAKTGPAKGKVSMLPTMLPKYYQARGWDSEGRPTAETKKRLGL